jgi:alginate O-acetyltransferase complex protein AlgI
VITFLASGIWHGSTWGFVVWGLLHGSYLALSVFYKPVQKKIYGKLGLGKNGVIKAWRMLVTFNLVCFAWIFFRSNTVADSGFIISSIVRDFHHIVDIGYVKLQFRGLGLDKADFLLSLFFVSMIVVVDILEAGKGGFRRRLLSQPAWIRWPVYYMILFSIIYFAQYTKGENFIYMQF